MSTDDDALPADPGTGAASHIMGLHEKVDPIVDMVIGHRQRFLDNDFSEEGAEEAALTLHEALIQKVLDVAVGGR